MTVRTYNYYGNTFRLPYKGLMNDSDLLRHDVAVLNRSGGCAFSIDSYYK